jgi:6-phosphogluconolactonase (cycloisomerase 2 family)
MNRALQLAAAGGLALAAAAAVPAASQAATRPAGHQDGRDGAVFVQTDALAGNAVVVYDRAADGALRQAGTYPTGGLGGQLTGSVADHLSSQGSLAYDRASGLLYAVNAGSNTITVFSVDRDRLVRRQVIGSGGVFPVSIAVRGNLVYVLNARDGGSVQGYLRIGATLVAVRSWNRPLGLDPTLTPEFTHTPGQVAFTPDGSKLIVTTKANGNDIDVFAVGPFGGLSAAPVVNADPGNVPFGVTFDPAGHLVVAETGVNAVATFTVNRDGTLTLVARAATGQAATCWVAGHGALLYASNAGSGTVTGFSDDGSGALQPLGNTATDAGTVDAAFSPGGRHLYVETGIAGIVDEFQVAPGGALTETGSVTVPDAIGAEGIAAS